MGDKEKKNDLFRIRIGNREDIPLLLSTWETQDIQKEIGCTVAQMWDQVFGIEKIMEDEKEKTLFHIVENGEMQRKLGKLIRICGNAGLEEEGREPDLTDKWILRNMKPGMVMSYALIMIAVVNNAMKQEAGKKEDDGQPVDEILEEENRKKEPGSLPSGESAPSGSSPG
jgi:hypothetical protein